MKRLKQKLARRRKIDRIKKSKRYKQAREKLWKELLDEFGEFWQRDAALKGIEHGAYLRKIRKNLRVVTTAGYKSKEFGVEPWRMQSFLIQRGKNKGKYSYNPEGQPAEILTAGELHGRLSARKRQASIHWLMDAAEIKYNEAADLYATFEDEELDTFGYFDDAV